MCSPSSEPSPAWQPDYLKNAASTTVASFDAAASAQLSLSGSRLVIDPRRPGLRHAITLSPAAGGMLDTARQRHIGLTRLPPVSTQSRPSQAKPNQRRQLSTLTGTAAADNLQGLAVTTPPQRPGRRRPWTAATAATCKCCIRSRRQRLSNHPWPTHHPSATTAAPTCSANVEHQFQRQNLALDIQRNAGQTYRVCKTAFDAPRTAAA